MVEYYYSCYGYNIKTIDNSNMSLSTINPYRHRSYYQDNETGWCYLNSIICLHIVRVILLCLWIMMEKYRYFYYLETDKLVPHSDSD